MEVTEGMARAALAACSAQNCSSCASLASLLQDPSPRSEPPLGLLPLDMADPLQNLADIAGILGVALALVSLLILIVGSRPSFSGAWPTFQEILGFFTEEVVPPVVQEKILEFKIFELNGLLQTACCLLVPYTLWIPRMARLPWCALSVSLLQLALSLLTLFPAVITPKTFDAVFCGVVLLLSLVVAPFSVAEATLVPAILLADALMFALMAVRRRVQRWVPVHVVAACVFALATMSTIWVRGQSLLGDRTVVGTVVQAGVVLLVTMSAPVQERRSKTTIEQLLRMEELKELLAASQCLLRSCFDVVVELDAQGCIVSTGPELGSLLLRDSSRQCMQGTAFAGLIEDKEVRLTFENSLAAVGGQGLAENMHVSMRDACGNSLRLEMMWFGFTSVGRVQREKHYMLGLREFPDQVQRQGQGAELVRVPVNPWARSPVEVAVSDAASLPENSSVSSGSGVDAGAFVVVDSGDPLLPVRRVSASFRARVGHIRRGKPFVGFVARPVEFYGWLRSDLEEKKDCKVRLKMPQGDVKATCKLVRSQGDEEVGKDKTVLLFYSIHQDQEDSKDQAAPVTNRGTSPRSRAASLRSQGHAVSL